MNALPGLRFTFAQLLGHAPMPTPAIPKAAPVASRQPAAATRPTTPKPSRPTKAVSFAHLLAAPVDYEYDAEVSTGHARASAITAAAAKARGIIPVTKPPQGTPAAAILAAGRMARLPTGTRTPRPTGLAAKIIAAGKKRRGETA